MKDAVNKNTLYISDILLKLPYTKASISTFQADARLMGSMFHESVDLILTSPPYINVFNYHQNYRGIIECFDFDILKVANSEIGANRKHRSNRFKTVVQYALDMGDSINSFSNSLRDGGRMVIVVGRVSNVRSIPFYNSQIICDIVGLKSELQIEDISQRHFNNRFGTDIIEDILVIRKCGFSTDILSTEFANIGFNHLKTALLHANKEVVSDIENVILQKDKVFESPILNNK